ncbi:MAG: glycosyltransferase [bacterium]
MEKIINKSIPRVTVITPTYNRAGLISETIESVLGQSYKDFEYYILDDGSLDNTAEVVKPYLKDKRIKYLKHENEGEGNTVNWGWSLAKGDFFAVVNSDDPVKPNFLSDSIKTLIENPDKIVSYADWERIDLDGNVFEYLKNEPWDMENSLRGFGCRPTVPGTVIRKSALKNLKKIRKTKYRYYGDSDSFWELALMGDFIYIPKSLAYHRWHDGGLSSENSTAFVEDMIEFLKDYYSRDLPDNLLECEYDSKVSAFGYATHILSRNNTTPPFKDFEEFLKLTDTHKNSSLKPLVSIIIPIYNGSKYMRVAIDSALSQTYENVEVIIVNDGSTDDTDKIAKSYGNRIKYYSKKNGGVSTALNLAIKKARGEYISWLSHDDEYYPDKIQKQLIYLNRPNAKKNEIIYTNYYREDLIRGDSHENIMHPDSKFEYSKWFSLKLLFKADLHGCTLLIPRKCFGEIGYFDEKLVTTQDYDLWFRLINGGYSFSHLDSTLVLARSHPGQGTLTNIELCKKEVSELYQKAVDLFIDEINEQNENEYQELVGYLKEKGLIQVIKYMENKLYILKEKRDVMNIKDSSEPFYPLVTIIIPVYNGASYMREAIDSALAQTYKNIEIIVVNDGSADNTDEIAKSYADKIRYFSKKNGGASTALNLGIKHMRGQYFSWLSHDDQYYPNKIERQIEELGKLDDKNTIMMSDLDGINEKYEKIYQTDYTQHIKNYPPRVDSNIHPVIYNQTHGCTLLIPKVCFDEVGLFDKTQLVAQDFEFFYRAFLKYPHKLIPEVLVTARDSSERVGNRCKDGANIEYSALYISIIKSLTDDEIKLLAADRLAFYDDMREFFQSVGYSIALEYINQITVNNLQITSNDLIGNKFTGYDLHLQLREKNIDSKELVLNKESDDKSTFGFDFFAKDATKKLIQQSIFLDANLVHLHLIHNIIDLNYLPVMTKLKPTVMTLHDPFFFGGHCVHHFDCNKWQTHCSDCPYLREMFSLDKDISALNFELKKDAIQNSQITAIVASKWMKDKIAKSPIWQGKKVYLLPFGVDQGLFKPISTDIAKKHLNIPVESTVIMFRADEGSFKGLDVIKKSLLGLKTTKNITLISVGQLGLLNDLQSKYNVLEYDWIKNDNQLARLYQATDIFLMPSRQETFGMMAVEAMSCGKMVLALKCDGSALSEVISSPICGLAVDEFDFEKTLQRLIDNPKEILDRGNKSLQYAQKKYSKERFLNGMMKIYDEVMSNHVLIKSSGLILQQLKKVPSNDLSLGQAMGVTQVTAKPIDKVIRRKVKNILRRILWYGSPSFRMLEGNRFRLNQLLEKTDKLLSERENK